MTQQEPDYGQTAKKTALGTVIVIAVLITIFCGIPLTFCACTAALGSLNR